MCLAEYDLTLVTHKEATPLSYKIKPNQKSAYFNSRSNA